MATATLYALIQSPWTERALWALEHHRIPFTYHEHLPMLGELLLRRKAGASKATVPLLVDGQVAVMGSSAIAKHADAVGSGAPIHPAEHAEVIERWSELADRMAHVGRAWLSPRV